MSENNEQHVRIVPAICTNCGAQLKVDPSQEAAVCEYCGTPFIVEKAINKYNVENAHIDKIDHVDTVNVDLKGSVDSVVGMLEREWDKSREESKEFFHPGPEERKEERKSMAVMMAILFAALIVMLVVAKFIGF